MHTCHFKQFPHSIALYERHGEIMNKYTTRLLSMVLGIYFSLMELMAQSPTHIDTRRKEPQPFTLDDILLYIIFPVLRLNGSHFPGINQNFFVASFKIPAVNGNGVWFTVVMLVGHHPFVKNLGSHYNGMDLILTQGLPPDIKKLKMT